jgi:hypothetical protein
MTSDIIYNRLTAQSKTALQYQTGQRGMVYRAAAAVLRILDERNIDYRLDASPYSPSLYIRLYTTNQDGTLQMHKFRISNHSVNDVVLAQDIPNYINILTSSIITFINKNY